MVMSSAKAVVEKRVDFKTPFSDVPVVVVNANSATPKEAAPATGTGKVRFVRYGTLVVGFANVSGTSIGTSGAKLCVIPEMARPRSWQRLPISGDSVNAAAEVSSDGTMKVWSMEAEKTLTRLISTFSYYLI